MGLCIFKTEIIYIVWRKNNIDNLMIERELSY